ncbi:hypothetical protein AB0M50_36220 [Nonomuraea fuscirosea]|uniref:hypothetical protein n=1 Tax=Nonomuraea fuscirosea TaxID=1291556 RepID=UPI003437B27E
MPGTLTARSSRPDLSSVDQLSAERLRGDARRALEAFEGALAIVRSVHHRIGETYVLHGTGEAQAALGQVEQSERALSRALEMAQELGERHIEGRTRLSLGLLLSRQGNPGGVTHLEKAHAMFTDMGAERWRAKAEEALARSR